MKDLHAFLCELRELGIKLWVEGDRLKLRAPDGVLTPRVTDALRERKSEILALLRPEPVIRIPELPPQDHYALSAAQRRLWVLTQLPGGSVAYNIPLHQLLEGPLDRRALETAMACLIDRHESLRTTFVSIDGEPRQVVHVRLPAPIEFRDLRGSENAEGIARQLGRHAANQPFDLATGPLLRAGLLRLTDERHVLLLTIAHIIGDGISLGVLARDLSHLYKSVRSGLADDLPRLNIGYPTFAAWQNGLFTSDIMSSHRKFWHQVLAGDLPVLDLPTDFPRPPVQGFRGGELSFALAAERLEALQAFCRARNATLFMVLHATLKVLLHAYTGQEDIVIGCPVAGREHPDLTDQIGFYLNILPLRSIVRAETSFEDFFGETAQLTKECFDHQIYPFDQLVGELNVARDLSRSPLFDVMLVLQNQDEPGLRLDGIEAQAAFEHPQTSKYDLTFCFNAVPSGLILAIEYDTDLFRRDRIERMGGHFLELVVSILANPCEAVGRLNLLTEKERRQLLCDFNQTATPYPPDQTVVDLLAAAAERTPDAMAVVCGTDRLTFRELQARSNQLAHYLLARGVEPSAPVALCIGRSLEMVVGLIAILKTGAPYVPLDPTFPIERLAYILENAGARWLITWADTRRTLADREVERIDLDLDREQITRCSDSALHRKIDHKDLAYVIYTSGSTGRPKGIEITHGSLANLLVATARTPGLTQHDVMLAVTTVSFDIAALELYLPLIQNALLVVAGDDDIADGARLTALLHDCRATVMQATPATWRLLLAAGWQGNPKFKVICGGEALPGVLAEQLLARAGSVWNMYGPTETTVWSTLLRLDHADGVRRSVVESIGRPIANTEIYILDRQLRPAAVGVPGDLYIAGAGLALGYRNLPELTSERFLPHPFSREHGQRIYKTGDLARYRDDGCIEYLGRADQQVKLRGFRIELGEIEAALATHRDIHEAVVDGRDDAAGDRRIVAWYVGSQEVSSAALRDHLQRKLPDYMIPALFVRVQTLPITPNGKVDRNALVEPDREPRRISHRETPRTDWERRLARLWEEILKVSSVGIHDNFFELGGHSLKAADFIVRLQKETGVRLSLVDIFRKPSVASLAAHSIANGNGIPLVAQTGVVAAERISPADAIGDAGHGYIRPASAEELELLKRT